MESSSDNLSLWEVLCLIMLGLGLFFGARWLIHHKEEEISCVKGKFTEWLEQLRFVKDEIETNLDASEFFDEGGF